MGSMKSRLNRQRKADNAYKQALGLPTGAELPAQLGTASSAGAARGGRGAAQRRQARQRPIGDGHGARRIKPGARQPVTGAAARVVVCPRCLAAADQPCRDQHGKAYSPSHAARQHKAAAAVARRPELAPPKPRQSSRPAPLTQAQLDQREIYRQRQAERERLTGAPTSKDKPRGVKVAKQASPAPSRALATSGVLDQVAKGLTVEQARAVACPSCKANAGEPCRGSKRKPLPEVHPQRRLARVKAVIARQRNQAPPTAS